MLVPVFFGDSSSLRRKGPGQWTEAAALGLVVAACSLAACGSPSGALVLVLDAPGEPSLDPLSDPRIRLLDLRLQDRARTLVGEMPASAEGRYAIGALPVGSPLALELRALTDNSQVIGMGRIRELWVESGEQQTLEVALRKPLAYIADGEAVRVVDTSAAVDTTEGGSPELASLPLANALFTASTSDGTHVLAATRGMPELVLYETRSHAELGRSALPFSPERPGALAVGARDRQAIVTHHHDGRVTIVDLQAFLRQPSGELSASTVEIAYPIDAQFAPSGRTAYVLAAELPAYISCLEPPATDLWTLDLDNRQLSSVRLSSYASDLAVHPHTGRPVVTYPCRDQVVVVDPASGEEQQLTTLATPLDVALAGAKLVVLGMTFAPARGILVVLDSETGVERRSSFTMPPLRYEASFGGWVVSWLTPTSALIYDLAVSADGSRAVFGAASGYTGEVAELRGTETCRTKLVELTSFGYHLLDLDAGVLVHSVEKMRTASACTRVCAVLGETAGGAGQDCRQEVSRSGTIPSGVTILFGGS